MIQKSFAVSDTSQSKMADIGFRNDKRQRYDRSSGDADRVKRTSLSTTDPVFSGTSRSNICFCVFEGWADKASIKVSAHPGGFAAARIST
jgi:hypothetical protein